MDFRVLARADIALAASDVDGTILPRGGVISRRTIRAVQACAARGIPFVIASGRWYVSAKVIADALGLSDGYMIIANGGAVVRMDGVPLRQWRMSRAAARRAYEIARRENVMINAFVPDAVYRVNTGAMRKPPKGLGDYLGGAYHMHNDDVAQFEARGLDGPYKIEVYADDEALLDRMAARFRAEGFSVSSAYSNNLELMEPGCGKGTAMRWLCDALNVPFERRLAFGDNLNDLDLLEAAGWPVAVDNAVPALKAAARIVAPACEDDGPAQVLEAVLNLREE